MMEQSTQTNNIIERPKKGRPKGTAIFTEEENKERSRQKARLHYSLNLKKGEKESDENIMQKTLFKLVLCFNFISFVNFHLNNWQAYYILGDLQICTHST